MLEALLRANADPADIVHHAEAAGAEDVVAEYALVAARRAAALGSNREAFSHYRRASEIGSCTPAAEQAAVLTAARRTPIFCEVTVSMDVIPRQFQPWAVPLLYTAPLDGRETAELTVP